MHLKLPHPRRQLLFEVRPVRPGTICCLHESEQNHFVHVSACCSQSFGFDPGKAARPEEVWASSCNMIQHSNLIYVFLRQGEKDEKLSPIGRCWFAQKPKATSSSNFQNPCLSHVIFGGTWQLHLKAAMLQKATAVHVACVVAKSRAFKSSCNVLNNAPVHSAALQAESQSLLFQSQRAKKPPGLSLAKIMELEDLKAMIVHFILA